MNKLETNTFKRQKEELEEIRNESFKQGRWAEQKETTEKVKKLKEHIKEIMWCNAHDVGLLEDLIIKIDRIFLGVTNGK